jgi:hypothetical protein
VKVRQYAYLLVTRTELDPGIISERLGLMPDRVKLRGQRDAGPRPIPRFHMWQVNSGITNRDARLGDHLESLLTRLNGTADRLRALVDSGAASGVVQVFREFEPGPEDSGSARDELPPGFEKLGGQHRFLGFAVPPDLLRYVVDAGIAFDFDEYGDEDE